MKWLFLLLFSTAASAGEQDINRLVTDQALEIRSLHGQIDQLKQQLTAQQAAPNQQLATAQLRLQSICGQCGVTTSTPNPTPATTCAPQKAATTKSNRALVVAGSGPNGLVVTPGGASPTVAQKVGPVVGLGYSRVVYDDWSAFGLATRSLGTRYVNYTALVGAGYDW